MSLFGSGRAGKSQFGVIWRHVAADANFVISDTTSVISDTKSLVRRHEIRGWAHVFREGRGNNKRVGEGKNKGGGKKRSGAGEKAIRGDKMIETDLTCASIGISVSRYLVS